MSSRARFDGSDEEDEEAVGGCVRARQRSSRLDDSVEMDCVGGGAVSSRQMYVVG